MSLLDLETGRLRAAPWQDLTAAELADLFAPEVVQWLPAGFQAQGSDESRRDFLAAVSQQAEVAALCNTAGKGVGLIILSFPEEGGSIRNLGYLFAEIAWGQGLASELISGLQAHFRGSGVTLSGGVMQENAASAWVLQKAGFTPEPAGAETVYSWFSGG
ncbi:GNAT family N-acetyltransferase [Leisingera sp. ANG59]|uniref:GNAT family N-acetyltransferase n=1 Tax=Leisingera sp. ANG59 TaxID=2675221 RepID=UPI001572EACB|nr:GNAT family N-acetyltransferase [Leisingera sp. ANG59]NSY37605.1 GNAT family N-acetyltransferase [Leisingera sp. ANG59]